MAWPAPQALTLLGHAMQARSKHDEAVAAAQEALDAERAVVGQLQQQQEAAAAREAELKRQLEEKQVCAETGQPGVHN